MRNKKPMTFANVLSARVRHDLSVDEFLSMLKSNPQIIDNTPRKKVVIDAIKNEVI